MSVLRVLQSSPKYLTLVIVREQGRVLLGKKLRGFGAGYINGFGGKVEAGETIRQAAIRELHEEAGLSAQSADWRGVLTFHFDDDPRPWEVHVFRVLPGQYSGEPHTSDEMEPAWYSDTEIPYENMWSDDKHWYPLFLSGKRFRGVFEFVNTHTMVSHKLEELQAGHGECDYLDVPLVFGTPETAAKQ